MNDFMKAVYGYGKNERNITRKVELPQFISETSQEGNPFSRPDNNNKLEANEMSQLNWLAIAKIPQVKDRIRTEWNANRN